METNKSVQSADKNVYNQDVVFLIAYLLIAWVELFVKQNKRLESDLTLHSYLQSSDISVLEEQNKAILIKDLEQK